MRSALIRVAVSWHLIAVTWTGWSATTPLYINDSPVLVNAPPDIAPQIDARAFVNRSLFSISSSYFGTLPYETLNTLLFTNRDSGLMFGNPGFRFNLSTDGDRLMMDSWVNQGRIEADSPYYSLYGEDSNWLLVYATNIVSTGPIIGVGSQGLLRLEGKNIDLTRNGVRSGSSLTNTGFLFGSSVLSSNYFNDVGITDIYWGTGTNNSLRDNGRPMRLDGLGTLDSLSYTLPFPQSPYHGVIQNYLGYTSTNTVTVPSYFLLSYLSNSVYGAAVFTNQINLTNRVIQVVFYPTNSADTNYSREVRFYPDFTDAGATVVVGFHSADFDIISQTRYTNSIYLVDALAFETNYYLARNYDTTTRRPWTYEVTRNQPYFYSYFGATNGNASYDPTLIYDPTTYASNQVQTFYAAYQAQISSLNDIGFTVPGSPLADPTNFPGRIEIIGDKVNLNQTRIRADSTLVLRAGNLTSNRVAQVDAPYVIFDVGSTEPLLLISNIAPQAVRRLNGTISAWSGIWQNYEVNPLTTNLNLINFHVLIVDDNLISLQPVLLNEFRVRANNLNIFDPISVGKSIRLDMTGLDVEGSLQLPPGASWTATNVFNLINFTNRGTVSMDGKASFGADRPTPYENFVNSGTVSAASFFVDTRNFDNSGSLVANGGVLSVDTLRARLLGAPTIIVTNQFLTNFFGFTNLVTVVITNSLGARLWGNFDVELSAQDLVSSNSLIQAGVSSPGKLILNVTDRLVDSGADALNVWECTSGFALSRKPQVSDLLGTEIRSTSSSFAEVQHFWPADDLGPTTDGFHNNLPLGKLILDAKTSFSALRFAGTSPNRALYVDYIQLENYATNYTSAITVEPSLTVYFADANVPAEKLTNSPGSRFRWISTYVGPYSATNITYPSGRTYTFNRALVSSRDLDSDLDGIPNAVDPTPIYVADDLSILLTKEPPYLVFLSWTALANAANRLEYKDSLRAAAPWQVLTTVVINRTAPVFVPDLLPTPASQRFYRIRIDEIP